MVQMMINIEVVLGAMLLGLGAGLMLLVRGQILGCSGILFRVWDFSSSRFKYDNLWFLLGLVLSGLITSSFYDIPDPNQIFKLSPILLFFGGVLVGVGTFLSDGCTSGHGLCGLSLMRTRSLVAVCIFFPVAIITAWLVH